MSTWSQWALQDAVSPVMEEFVFFHDFVMCVLAYIVGFVGVLMTGLLSTGIVHRGLLEGQTLETVWTLIPALILTQIGVPSLILLYSLDDISKASLTIKSVGHQWYWTYEYGDFFSESEGWAPSDEPSLPAGEAAASYVVESYMLAPTSSGDHATCRLYETLHKISLPLGTPIRNLITSEDVLHSWTIPSLGVKADANPGRLNQVSFYGFRPGLVLGQCSEICGANHSFMPIALYLVSAEDFLSWVHSGE